VLSNEKYIENYIFDKSASKDLDGKRNGHKYKDDEDIVRIEDLSCQLSEKAKAIRGEYLPTYAPYGYRK
jgi:hypothetical protein